MKKSVLSKPEHQAHLSKTGFDMSQMLQFTSSVGHLLPVYYDFLNPGEKITCDFTLFTRTQPVTTAALSIIDEHVELFFVPAKKINSAFNQLVTNVDDLESSLWNKANLITSGANKLFPQFKANPTTTGTDDDYFINLNNQYCRQNSSYETLAMGVIRLSDLLGYNPNAFKDFKSLGRFDYNPALSIMLPCAYQAIYYDYYRLSDWEDNRIQAYNVDDILNAQAYPTTPYVNWAANYISRFWELRYRPYQKDYMKAIHPAPLLGSAGVLESRLYVGGRSNYSGGSLTADGLSLFGTAINGFGSPVSALPAKSVNSSLSSADISNPGAPAARIDLNAVNLRGMFALEKMMRIQNFAGKHYDDQILAHYGFKVPQGISNEVYFIGAHHQELRIGEVLSTANTDTGVLGQSAGRGYQKGSSKKLSFTAPCHGILMAIYSAVPRQVYVPGIDRINSIYGYYDIYQPELDKLGMQPQFGYESMPRTANSLATTAVGWQWRYMHFKSKYDKASSAFSRYVTLSPETGGQVVMAPFKDWSNADFNPANAGVDTLVCSPFDLNKIMAVSFNHYRFQYASEQDKSINITNMFATDPLIHQLETRCFKTSTMSKFGIENI